jgi:hypothetical protein
MSEQKRFKAFRSELNESEYKEVLTGYPNRGIDTENGPVNFGPERMAQINAMLNAISRSTFQSPSEAFIRIKTRLNLLMLDFPWTPYLWQDGGTGPVTLTVTLFGRVDGIDGNTANVVMNGKANPTAGLQEFTLIANIEIAEDGLYRVNAKLQPQIAVMPEGVEHDGDSIDEMAQTPARQRDMEHAIQRAEAKAQRGYEAKMTKTGKAGERGRKQEAKHDAASRRLIARDTKEYDSPKLYGRGGKVVKGKRKPVKEEAEQIEEMLKAGDKVKVPHKGKMVRGRIVRHDSGGSGKAQQHGGGYVVDVGEYGSITVPGHKVVKEAAEQIDELSKKTKDAYVAKRGSQLSSMLSGHTRGKQLTGKQQANAVKGIKQAMGGNKDKSKLPKLLPRMATFGEELVGGQKRLDVNKNKRLDAQDFKMLRSKKKPVEEALIGGQKRLDVNKNKRLDSQDFKMLRAKKKPMKEYTETMGGIPLTAPDPTAATADKSGKGKRFHKGAIKSVAEAVAKVKKAKKPSPHQGAANVIGKQKAIKSRLEKHNMRW